MLEFAAIAVVGGAIGACARLRSLLVASALLACASVIAGISQDWGIATILWWTFAALCALQAGFVIGSVLGSSELRRRIPVWRAPLDASRSSREAPASLRARVTND